VPASVDTGLPTEPSRLFANVASILKTPDLMIGNLEGALTDRGTSKCAPSGPSPQPGLTATPTATPSQPPEPSHCFAFRSPPHYARLFAAAGYDVLSLANNHSHDYGAIGLADTRAAVESAGLETTGLPGQVTVRVVRGVRVAIVGFAPYYWTAPLNDPAAVRALVARARMAARVVIVVFHGGAEGAGAQHVPPGRETAFGEDRGDLRAFARTALSAGASVVLGAGPHVVRGMEVVGGRLVAYSVGNFVGYRTLSTAGPTGVSCVLRVTLAADGAVLAAQVVSTLMVPPGYPIPDPQRRAVDLIRRLSVADFGPTAASLGRDGWVRMPVR
jgi:Bacterial capsule synthesis protein PGA_cap